MTSGREGGRLGLGTDSGSVRGRVCGSESSPEASRSRGSPNVMSGSEGVVAASFEVPVPCAAFDVVDMSKCA